MKSFFKRTKIINNFRKKNKRNKQRKRKDFAKILCFINIVFIFQRESTENIQTIKKKPIFIEFVTDLNVLTYNTSMKENCKILKKLHEIF